MAPMLRVTTRWDGFSGAPGFSIMHFRDFDTDETVDEAEALAVINRVVTFFQETLPYIPDGVTLTTQREVEVIEDTTGQLVSAYSYGGTLNPQEGVATGAVAGPAGAVVNWRTGNVRNGRRIRGRTFLVPLAASAYETNGTLLPSCVTALTNAANALIATSGSPDFGVYSRPSAPGASDGQWVVATGANVPDMVAILRSRRD